MTDGTSAEENEVRPESAPAGEPRDDAVDALPEDAPDVDQTRMQQVRERLSRVPRRGWVAAGVALLVSTAGAVVVWRKRR